ncbi:MAG: hypothetical protein ABW352_20550, partial [Polyangiales bacterium]
RIKEVMLRTGVPVMDTRNGLTFPSLRALAAVKEVCTKTPDQTPDQAEDGGSSDARTPVEAGPPAVDPDQADDDQTPEEGVAPEEEELPEEEGELAPRDASARPGGNGAARDSDREGCQLSASPRADLWLLLVMLALWSRLRPSRR